MESAGIRYRWFIENCHEFVLPSGEVLLVDPMLPPAEDKHWAGFYSGYTPDDLQRVDYVFISHTHGDHIAQLKEVVTKFNPFILGNTSTLTMLAKALDLPVRKFIPMVDYQTYDFGSFKFTPYPGTHVATLGDQPISEAKARFAAHDDFKTEEEADCMAFGTCFNNNFLLEAPGGIRIAFIQGQYTALTKYAFMHMSPTLVIRQLSRIDLFPQIYDELLECIEDTQTGLTAFMCHHHKEKDPVKTAAQLNADLEAKGSLSRVFVPEKGRWMKVCNKIDFIEG